MRERGSFDLLDRKAKPDWQPEVALVVSPYVERAFFKKLAKHLRPETVCVVLDDGCRCEDRKTVESALWAGGHKKKSFFFKLGSAPGLVHIKLFYIRWKSRAGRPSHSLVFGSANATRQGFSGTVNAELVAGCALTVASHGAVIDWCDRVIEATRADGEVKVDAVHGAQLAKGMQLRLPSITIGRTRKTVSNFDLWIQRGYLLSPYRPDPSFLRILVELRRSLNQGEEVERVRSAGFDFPQARSIRHRYVEADFASEAEELEQETEGHGSAMRPWRSQLFTWTQLGDWCSDACFAQHKALFRRGKHEEREHALEQLGKLAVAENRDAAKAAFLEKLARLWEVLGEEAPEFLCSRRRRLDRDHYGDHFDKRVARDLALIQDPDFCNRFIRGFELVQVPRFRNDIKGWRQFVHSLAEQLVLDAQRGQQIRSQLLKAIKEAGGTGALDSQQDLIKWLRRIWDETKPRDEACHIVSSYHEGLGR